jgi:hypothetical protein
LLTLEIFPRPVIFSAMDYDKLYGPLDLLHRKRELISVPEDASMEEIATSLAPLALQTLADIAMNSSKDAARVAASNAILDRGYGKPGQSVTVYAGKANMKVAWQAVDAEYSVIDEPVPSRPL